MFLGSIYTAGSMVLEGIWFDLGTIRYAYQCSSSSSYFLVFYSVQSGSLYVLFESKTLLSLIGRTSLRRYTDYFNLLISQVFILQAGIRYPFSCESLDFVQFISPPNTVFPMVFVDHLPRKNLLTYRMGKYDHESKQVGSPRPQFTSESCSSPRIGDIWLMHRLLLILWHM